jgi:hypothetical protein
MVFSCLQYCLQASAALAFLAQRHLWAFTLSRYLTFDLL